MFGRFVLLVLLSFVLSVVFYWLATRFGDDKGSPFDCRSILHAFWRMGYLFLCILLGVGVIFSGGFAVISFLMWISNLVSAGG